MIVGAKGRKQIETYVRFIQFYEYCFLIDLAVASLHFISLIAPYRAQLNWVRLWVLVRVKCINKIELIGSSLVTNNWNTTTTKPTQLIMVWLHMRLSEIFFSYMKHTLAQYTISVHSFSLSLRNGKLTQSVIDYAKTIYFFTHSLSFHTLNFKIHHFCRIYLAK